MKSAFGIAHILFAFIVPSTFAADTISEGNVVIPLIDEATGPEETGSSYDLRLYGSQWDQDGYSNPHYHYIRARGAKHSETALHPDRSPGLIEFGRQAELPILSIHTDYDGYGNMILNEGSLGIGVDHPLARIHISGTNGSILEGLRVEGSNPTIRLSDETNGSDFIFFSNDHELRIANPSGSWPQSYMTLSTNGNLGLGTSASTHKLSVNGTVRAKEVIVDTNWSDFVFEPTYRLRPLVEVEEHIEEHGHLPDVPSASTVQSEGLSVGEAQKIMMQKIEELTLYVIELKRENEAQQREIEKLKSN